ncbi:MAG: hypothetical protein LBC64_01905 [Fibromonadaceae bacterium]|nr:hypothetical protein [Fibromonadaceae bacterium]
MEAKNLDCCIYAKPQFCKFERFNCSGCSKQDLCCAHIHDCEPWHCGIYNEYLQQGRKP